MKQLELPFSDTTVQIRQGYFGGHTFYVAWKPPGHEALYLHKDGIWCDKTCRSCNGIVENFLGYYDTKEEAQSAFDKYGPPSDWVIDTYHFCNKRVKR